MSEADDVEIDITEGDVVDVRYEELLASHKALEKANEAQLRRLYDQDLKLTYLQGKLDAKS